MWAVVPLVVMPTHLLMVGRAQVVLLVLAKLETLDMVAAEGARLIKMVATRCMAEPVAEVAPRGLAVHLNMEEMAETAGPQG